MPQKSIEIIKRMRAKNGLFIAGGMPESTHYARQSWIRDNIYTAIGIEAYSLGDVISTYHSLLDILLKHEEKIDWAIKKKPEFKHEYIHARYDPHTLNEFWEDWGNKQNDAIGAFLFKIGDLSKKGLNVLRSEHDRRILQKVIYYLQSIEYWHDADNGMWEENEEVHASSVGACVAGLDAVKDIVFVPDWLIEKGREALDKLLPRESVTKEVDLALLSLIYPYDVVSAEQRDQILRNVEEKLVRKNGVIRYHGDYYYNKNGEAEWCMGFPWLAIIYRNIDKDKYNHYIEKTESVMTDKGEIPELYYAGSDEYNENTPLAWAQALYVVAKKEDGSSEDPHDNP